MDRLVNTPLTLSLHAALAAATALCAALDLSADAVPELIHLLPAGTIRTLDGRGPYHVADMQALIAHSLDAGGRLVIDENHATDLAAPEGRPAPAMGWIVALEARADGLWGRVEWTPAGRALVEARAYRGVSPVIAHDKAGAVKALLRASLVNRPNIKNLTTLHQETDMDLLARLIAALGLAASTSEDALVAAVTTLHQAGRDASTALQAQLAPIVRAAGLGDGATAEQLVTAIGALRAKPDATTITALQAEIAQLTTDLSSERDTRRRREAETFVDAAIKEGRTGVKPLRDHYVTRHMTDPAGVEKEISAMPKLVGRVIQEPAPRDGEIALNAEQRAVARMLGQDPKTYAETLQLEAAAAAAADAAL